MRRPAFAPVFCLLVGLLLGSGCGDDLTEGMVLGGCTDGIDNDGDGAFDCLDSDCSGSPDCAGDDDDTSVGDDDDTSIGDDDSATTDDDDSATGDDDDSATGDDDDSAGDDDDSTPVDPEVGANDCTDTIDNDGDELVDCADPDCSTWYLCREDSLQTCSDGIDNDGNNDSDCADAGCATQAHCREQGNCDDGLDNDGDQLVDCLDIDDCGSSSICDETVDPEICNDAAGVDEDADNLANCLDPDCFGQTYCQEASNCNDCEDSSGNIGTCDSTYTIPYDNDGDGNANCADTQCAGQNFICIEALNCSDGIDNDLANGADCADPACATSCGSTEVCDDAAGADEDQNGTANCDDPVCAVVCLEQLNCDDGQDNDGDAGQAGGGIDCEDTDCANATNCLEGPLNCTDCEDASGNIGACDSTYTIPHDNDGNNLANCADPGCAGASGCYEVCGDGVDNDGINGTDCADPTCATTFTGNPPTVPGCFEVCGDGHDNDGVNGADCADPACATFTGTPPTVLACFETCGDGVDNDGVNGTDCDDSACAGQCEDCLTTGDEDGNLLADCADPVCWPILEGHATLACPEVCDGLGYDEDNDGGADCGDEDCTNETLCPEDCTNGIDDDADTYADCDDTECMNGASGVAGVCVENDPTLCDNGTDDDGDGQVDCDDQDCLGVSGANCDPETCDDCEDSPGSGNIGTCDSTTYTIPYDNTPGNGHGANCLDPQCWLASTGCQEVCDITPGNTDDEDDDGLANCLDPDCTNSCPENTQALCSNGIDDDADNLIDCLDQECIAQNFHFCIAEDCSDPTGDLDNDGDAGCFDDECSNGLQAPCFENTAALCDDTLDNDGDGLDDCDDPDCQSILDPNTSLPLCGEICDNTTDDDGDGDSDCDDLDCCADSNCPGSSCPTEDCAPTNAGGTSNDPLAPPNTPDNDEDFDGSSDCADPDCSGFPICSANWTDLVTVTTTGSCPINANGNSTCTLPAGDPGQDPSSSSYIPNPNAIQAVDIEVTIEFGTGTSSTVGDLRIKLENCNSSGNDLLLDNTQGLSGNNLTATIFDNNSFTSISSGSALNEYNNRFAPQLSGGQTIGCNGYAANDTWQLTITNPTGDTGTVLNWSVHFDLGDVEHCNDGIDNDGDFDIDCDDSGCDSNYLCGPGTGGGEICDNFIDDDAGSGSSGDGFIDCADIACSTFTGPNNVLCEYPLEESCGDSGDNNGDGLTDCADSNCTGAPECSGGDVDTANGDECDDGDLQTYPGGSCDMCFNGADDDGNGSADCGCAVDPNGGNYPGDPTCLTVEGVCDNVDPNNCTGCPAPDPNQDESECGDGCDNDGDGDIDCDDFDCCADQSFCSGTDPVCLGGIEICDDCSDPNDSSRTGTCFDLGGTDPTLTVGIENNALPCCATGNCSSIDEETCPTNCDEGASCHDFLACSDEGTSGTGQCDPVTGICPQCQDCGNGLGYTASCFYADENRNGVLDGNEERPDNACTSLNARVITNPALTLLLPCLQSAEFDDPIDNNTINGANCDDPTCATNTEACPPISPNEGDTECHAQTGLPGSCNECYDGLDNEPDVFNPTFTGDGADCNDPEALACANDAACRACSEDATCRFDALGENPTNPDVTSLTVRAHNCFMVRAHDGDTATNCP